MKTLPNTAENNQKITLESVKSSLQFELQTQPLPLQNSNKLPYCLDRNKKNEGFYKNKESVWIEIGGEIRLKGKRREKI